MEMPVANPPTTDGALLARLARVLHVLRGYVACLSDIDGEASSDFPSEEIAEFADMFRVIAPAAAEGAASLEMLANSTCETRQ